MSASHKKWIEKEWLYIRRALQAGHYYSMGSVEYPGVGFIQTEAADH